MSNKCELTGKGFLNGNNVSHANNKTKKRFNPNLQKISFISDKLKNSFLFKVAARTIRTVEKNGGLDQFLLSTSSANLSNKALKIKKRILTLNK